jgi:hypothetical protein
VPNQGNTGDGERQPFCTSPKTAGLRRNCKTGLCHGEAPRSVLAKIRGEVLARFCAVAAEPRNRTRNAKFDLLGPVLRATTTAV